ncbi:hypothetical protein PV08_08036 [Exophiala spinifera]|uniref:Xylanolytic transcriptional activator regulatory domain-containing protein n=1 Tax=Exophiala spinifera TaxID=91928 RepID=A0A0D2BP11_9EURO|nr:uncharacterized protein PV08_08036 [Exophiala spinifera]KIW12849.1 hypothetical protein PV08_08036 [Exophiala spinifera]
MGSDVLEFYPDAHLALRLWNVYINSVDPVVKLLHIPTIQSTIVATILDPRSAQPSKVALTFAIYYAAITALCHDDDHEPLELPCEKLALLNRYKLCLDQLLVVPDLMDRPELAALQALAIYATCLRANEVGRKVWVLVGLAIRLAQSIGLHRDGASLRLSPFETEMRLRLWWHLCVLESRSPEDQGSPPTVDVTNRELRLPLNVNDNQIYPDMTHFPTESAGWTEMSFFLIQTESCRLLHPVLDTHGQHSLDAYLDITEKRKIIQQRSQYLYAKYSESGTPLGRLAAQHGTTGYKKMEFVLRLREEISLRKQKGSQGDPTPDVFQQSFKLACEDLESNQVLSNGDFGSRFKWFFNIYTPWYAIAYVLRCLSSSPPGIETGPASALVEEVFSRAMSLHDSHSGGLDGDYGHQSIWRYINVLRYQALSARHQRTQASMSTSDDDRIQTSNSGPDCIKTSQSLIDTAMTGKTATMDETTVVPESSQEFITGPSQNLFSPLDLSMPEIPFLPDWNAVINGCLTDDVYETNSTFWDDGPAASAQF